MFARVTELVGGENHLVEADLQHFKADILPDVEALPGMHGGLLLVDESDGRVLCVVFYDDESSLAESRYEAGCLRELVLQRMNLRQPPRVHEYEVALAHLGEPATVVTG